jgi:hypothetical protein
MFCFSNGNSFANGQSYDTDATVKFLPYLFGHLFPGAGRWHTAVTI